jgi:nucleoside-diphosphate-sugar epimerase
MVSDGTPWRPLVHVADICEAVACVLEAPRDVVHREIFNVGDTKENYQVRDIAAIVSAAFPGCRVSLGSSDGDNRSYRVSFDKIHEKLPNYVCRNTAESGARELYQLFDRIAMAEDLFGFRAYTRLKQLEHLIRTKQLDRELFWNAQ